MRGRGVHGRRSLAAFLLALVSVLPASWAQPAEPPAEGAGEPIEGQPVTLVHHDLSDPLPVMAARRRARGLPPQPDRPQALSVLRPPDLASRARAAEPGGDPLLQAQRGRVVWSAASTPAPLRSASKN